jgi:hypothetical protein
MTNTGNRVKPKWLPQMDAPKDYILNELGREGVVFREEETDPTALKPLQGFVDKAKADMFQKMIDNDEEIPYPFISADNGILDGHHRAYAFTKHPEVTKCRAIKIYLPNEDAARILNKIQDRFDFERELEAGGRPIMVPFGGGDEQLGGFNPQSPQSPVETQAMPMAALPPAGVPMQDTSNVPSGAMMGNPHPALDPRMMNLSQDRPTGQIDYEATAPDMGMNAAPAVTPDHIAGIKARMSQLAGTTKGEELGANANPDTILDTQDKTPEDDTDHELKEMDVVNSDNDGQPVPQDANTSVEDEVLPLDIPQADTEATDEVVPYDSATKNEQTRTVYKTQPINTKAKTGDFLILTQKNGFKYRYELKFDNLLELSKEEIEGKKFPTEAPLMKWMEGATPESLEAKAKESGLTHELYLSRTVNQEAKRKGFDGIQYGDKFVQIINDVN